MADIEMFALAAPFLFQNIPAWDNEYEQPAIVCIEHKKFLPCRKCMYDEPARVPYSCDPSDVRIVQIHQQGL